MVFLFIWSILVIFFMESLLKWCILNILWCFWFRIFSCLLNVFLNICLCVWFMVFLFIFEIGVELLRLFEVFFFIFWCLYLFLYMLLVIEYIYVLKEWLVLNNLGWWISLVNKLWRKFFVSLWFFYNICMK